MSKFPPRVWIIEKMIDAGGFNYSEFICNSKSWKSVYGFPNEYLSLEEHQAIISDLEKRLQIAREALDKLQAGFAGMFGYQEVTMLQDFYDRGEEIVNEALEKIKGETKR